MKPRVAEITKERTGKLGTQDVNLRVLLSQVQVEDGVSEEHKGRQSGRRENQDPAPEQEKRFVSKGMPSLSAAVTSRGTT